MKSTMRMASALALAGASALSVASEVQAPRAPGANEAMRGKIEAILGGAGELYVALAVYPNLSKETLLRGAGVTGLREESFKTPWGAPIKVSATSLETKDDAVAMEYAASGRASETCAFLKGIEAPFKTVSFGGRILKPGAGDASWNCDGVKPGAKVILVFSEKAGGMGG